MKNPSTYITSIVFTLLLIFLLLGAAGAGILHFNALNTNRVLTLVDAQQLPEKVHTSLEEQFAAQENSTGIPASRFASAIEPDALAPIIRDSVTNGFAYVCGDTATLGISPDLGVLENNLRRFFVDYAERNNIPQDAAFEESFKTAAGIAKDQIISACDVFSFSQLNDAGVLKQAKRVTPWTGFLAFGMFIACGLFMLFLLLLHHHEPEQFFYWTGTALAIASAVMLIPAAWLQQTHWFDRFAVKADQTFAAVTGYLYMQTHAAIVIAVCGLITAALFFILFAILHFRRKNHESVKHAKH